MEFAVDVSKSTIGFIGCGKISSAVCRGFASLDSNDAPLKLLVTRRSEEKSRALIDDFPHLVEVIDDIQDIINRSDILFIGLLPAVARLILPPLSFGGEISPDSSSDVCSGKVVRTVPLPSAAKRSGPILMYPPNPIIQGILSPVGTPIVCQTEAEMKPLISITGHISSFYELMRVTQDWTVQNGVQEDTARRFISSFYSSMAAAADSSHHSFAELSEEAATPGGLNEQSLGFLRQSEHYPLHRQSLESILNRLIKK